MKKLLTVILFLSAFNLSAQIIDTVNTDLQTADLALDESGSIIALSMGRDLNFDWLIDSTTHETGGTLFRIHAQTHEIIAQRPFETTIGKLAVSGTTGYFVQAAPMRISSFDTQTLATKIDTFLLENSRAGENFKFIELSGDAENQRLIVGTGGFTDAGEMRIFDASGHLLHAMKTAPGASDATAIYNAQTQSTAYLMINEGLFGSNSASMSYLNVQENISGHFGDAANDLLRDDDKLYIVLNGSHEIKIFDIKNNTEIGMLKTETSGYDGPRRISLLPGDSSIAVTTFKNDVRIFNLNSMQLMDSIAVGQKPERMAVFEDELFVANGGFSGFAEDSTIFVVDLLRKTVTDTIVCGPRTVDIILANDGYLYALSEGNDANFNTKVDAGETTGALFKIDPATHDIIAQVTLPQFAENLVLKPTNDHIHLLFRQSGPDRISEFDGTIFQFIADTLMRADALPEGNIYKFGYESQSGRIWVTTDNFDGSRGKIYFLENGSPQFRSAFSCGILPRDIIVAPNPEVPGATRWLVLNEGFYNAYQSSLTTIELAEDIFEPIAQKPLGDTANGITLADGKVYLAVNGSHTVQVLDVENWAYAGEIEVGTTGWDGPRQVAVQNQSGYISTFTNDVRRFDLNTLTIEETIPVGQKPEDILIADGKIFVANTGFSGFAEDSTIFVLQGNPSSVQSPLVTDTPELLSLAQNYPNPFRPNAASSSAAGTKIEFHLTHAGPVSLKIFNIRGQLIKTIVDAQLGAGSYQYSWSGRDRFNLPVAGGMYFYQLRSGNQRQSKKMFVQVH